MLLNQWNDSDDVEILEQDPEEVKRCEQAARDVQSKPTDTEQQQLSEEITKLNLPESMFDETMPPMDNPFYKSMGNLVAISSLLSSKASRQPRKVIYKLHADLFICTPTPEIFSNLPLGQQITLKCFGLFSSNCRLMVEATAFIMLSCTSWMSHNLEINSPTSISDDSFV